MNKFILITARLTCNYVPVRFHGPHNQHNYNNTPVECEFELPVNCKQYFLRISNVLKYKL